jgi:hypothetical protein
MTSSAWIVARRVVVPLVSFAGQRQRFDEPLRLDEVAGCGDG